MRAAALALFAVLACTGVSAAAVPAFDVPGAAFAIDPSGTLDLARARELAYQPAGSYRNPGVASIFHPLVLWLRFPAPASGTWYLVGASAVGKATLYAPESGSSSYAERPFGMRVPYMSRAVERLPPTARVPDVTPGAPVYVRIELDDESSVVPIATLMDGRGLLAQDAAYERLASTSLLFIGIFISLAAANVFVFFFVRERTYVVYSGMMLSNALFAATYLHLSAWHWLWPALSLPDLAVQAALILIEASFLLAFARSFMRTARVVPRLDRAATFACIALLVIAALIGYVFPSVQFGPVTGRDIFIINTVLYVVVVFGLGIAALRAGSVEARFFVLSNGAVSLAAAAVAVSNLSHHDVVSDGNFIALMTGQAFEGWLLFGALAYRLRQVIGAHMDEQQQRLVAQAEMLAQAQALNESRRLASTDGLTGIANRRMFDESIDREWYRCLRAGKPLALLLIDVDFFKKYNDAYGHVAGDECLRRVAGAIAACVMRPSDLCARYGGEEFAVLLPETAIDGARVLAEHICGAVRALGMEHASAPSGVVSVSIGVAAVVPAADGTVAGAIESADAALYRAKERGRDRVEIADASAETGGIIRRS